MQLDSVVTPCKSINKTIKAQPGVGNGQNVGGRLVSFLV